MDAFDRAEESRERNEGFAYEEYRERMSAELDSLTIPEHSAHAFGAPWRPSPEEDAYEPDDPKSDGYYERMIDLWDNREGK